MSLEDLVAVAGLLGVILYGVLGGADFGGGVWDLFAAGPRRSEQRTAIAHAMGPVWEANHVWLIFVIVLLFTAFPPAFAALSVGLFGLFHVVLIGITLRGAAFVFRGSEVAGLQGRRWGMLFGMASVITPVLLGMAVGVVSSGNFRVTDGQVSIEGHRPWFSPVALIIGALALALCAYLAAVYLTNETKEELQEDFKRRALFSGTFVVGLSVVALPVLYWDTPHLWQRLTGPRAAIVLASGVAFALLSGWALLRHRFVLGRVAAIGQVALLLLGWGLAQYPYLIYPDLTLHDAAAPKATLRFVLYSLPVGAALLLPSLWLLFRVFKSRDFPLTHAKESEMKKIITISLIAIVASSALCWGQVGGNSVYGQVSGKARAEQAERNKRVLTKEELPPSATSTFVEANVLMNVKADAYVAVFGITHEAETLAECSRKMEATVKAFADELKPLGFGPDALSVDFVAQNKVYGFQVQGDAAQEKLVGFELKKNISIRYQESSQIEKLTLAAAKAQIFDLVKVDYVVVDADRIQNRLAEEAARVIKNKITRYEKLLGIKLQPPAQIYAERPATYYPTQLYDSYTAFESEEIHPDRQKYTVKTARKSRTFFFNGLDGNGFDAVVNPVVTEPVVQFTLYLKVKYEVEQPKAK